MNQRLLFTCLIALLLTLGTLAAILWAKGYRPNLKERTVKGTGLLVVNSYPDGASVFLNDKLTTATNDTLHLPPGEYHVKIIKEGFIPWEKTLKLEPELVTQTNVRLFPGVPDLTALTFTGIVNVVPAPNGQRIAFAVASASADLKNGLWVLNLNDSPLKFSTNQIQIAQTTPSVNFAGAKLTWSPNSQQILVSLPTSGTSNGLRLLLPADAFTDSSNYRDVTGKLPLILEEWQQELTVNNQKRLEKLPLFMQQVATASAQNVFFSPDETKIVYLATKEMTIPPKLISPLPATSTQKEERSLKPGRIYVYDLKEDRNFLIKESVLPLQPSPAPVKTPKTIQPASSPQKIETDLAKLKAQYLPLFVNMPQWLATSQHLIFTDRKSPTDQSGKIEIIEYDGTNLATVYTGQFEDDFVFPWPSGNKLVILTSLNSLATNLYAINLR